MKVRNILMAAAGIGVAGIAVAGNVMYNIALSAKGNKQAIFNAEENKTGRLPGESIDLDSIDFKDEWITSRYDGILLHGNSIKRESDIWVIAMHGYSAYGKTAYEICEGWNKRGYSILCPDMRGHGESDGSYIGMGWHDRLDIISWIEYINEKYAPSGIILHGVSMGGAAVMMTAGEKLPSNVRCVVEDCGYATVRKEFEYEGKAVFNMPYYPVIWVGSFVTKLRAGWSFEEASAVLQLRRAKVPVMFIHGDADKFVPVEHVYEAYEACASEKEILVIEGASHAEAQIVAPDRYWSSVFEFVDRYI